MRFVPLLAAHVAAGWTLKSHKRGLQQPLSCLQQPPANTGGNSKLLLLQLQQVLQTDLVWQQGLGFLLQLQGFQKSAWYGLTEGWV